MMVISGDLSSVWARAFLETMNPGRSEIDTLVAKITQFDHDHPIELTPVRECLDDALRDMDLSSVRTVANTIFPRSLWDPNGNRADLFDRYSRVWPAIRKTRANCHGVYFRRFTSFRGVEGEVNQLDKIIANYISGNHRRSALQLSVYDPALDLVNSRQRGFPCLQHVVFTPIPKRSSLKASAFYATQLVVEKAYGNYLGLCELSQFVAHELSLTLEEVSCTATVAVRSKRPKGDLEKLGDELDSIAYETEEMQL